MVLMILILCLNHGIKAIETVDGDGRYTKNVPLFEGIIYLKLTQLLLKNLKSKKNYYQMVS